MLFIAAIISCAFFFYLLVNAGVGEYVLVVFFGFVTLLLLIVGVITENNTSYQTMKITRGAIPMRPFVQNQR